MKAARWLGQRDRLTVHADIDGVEYSIELGIIAVHVEPDKHEQVYRSMDSRGAQTLCDMAAMELCKHVRAR